MPSLPNSFGPRGFAGISQDGFQERTVIVGAGSPENVVSADPGALYFDNITGVMYFKAASTGFELTGWTTLIPGTLHLDELDAAVISADSGNITEFECSDLSVRGTFNASNLSAANLSAQSIACVGNDSTYCTLTSTTGVAFAPGDSTWVLGSMPTGIVVGCLYRVIEQLTFDGTDSFSSLGDGVVANKWGANLSWEQGVENGIGDFLPGEPPLMYTSASNLTLTSSNRLYTGGIIAYEIYYYTLGFPAL